MTLKFGKFDDVPTAGTDGKTIWFHEDFLRTLTLRQAVFVMCHEVAHAMWLHMSRGKKYADSIGPDGKPFDHQKWNIATDYVINAMLRDSNIGTVPPGALLDSKYTSQMSGEEVYRKLTDEESKKQPMDSHVYADSEASPEEWKRAVAAAANAAKAMGNLPAALGRFVDELLNPQVTWQEVLRKRITLALGRDSRTWAKLHRRRFVAQRIVAPGATGHRAGTIVVAVDTSGSIGQDELTTFLSEVQGILDDAQPEVVFLMSCDAKIHDEHELYPGDNLAILKPAITGGGGTSFKPPFERVEELGLRPDMLVYLTDMYGDFPKDPGYPVIWCATSNEKGPFGETLPIKIGGDA
jgi:predicted metal-dependent peptidase